MGSKLKKTSKMLRFHLMSENRSTLVKIFQSWTLHIFRCIKNVNDWTVTTRFKEGKRREGKAVWTAWKAIGRTKTTHAYTTRLFSLCYFHSLPKKLISLIRIVFQCQDNKHICFRMPRGKSAFAKESKEKFVQRKARRALAETLYEAPLLSALQENCIGELLN